MLNGLIRPSNRLLFLKLPRQLATNTAFLNTVILASFQGILPRSLDIIIDLTNFLTLIWFRRQIYQTSKYMSFWKIVGYGAGVKQVLKRFNELTYLIKSQGSDAY